MKTAHKAPPKEVKPESVHPRSKVLAVAEKSGYSIAMAPVLPEKETKGAQIAFRIPAKWKANIEAQLRALGVPDDRFAEFYRGAIIAGIGNAIRAQDPAWQRFVEEVQPQAKRTLGMALTDAGLEALIRQGTVLTGTLE
jgi:hypothetical protein